MVGVIKKICLGRRRSHLSMLLLMAFITFLNSYYTSCSSTVKHSFQNIGNIQIVRDSATNPYMETKRPIQSTIQDNGNQKNISNKVATDISEYKLDIYNLTAESKDKSNCVSMKIKPPVKICLHNDKEDVYISRRIRTQGVAWEAGTVALFQRILTKDKQLDVIDIGANIGVYSLAAATLGRKVIAVEPLMDNAQHLHKSIQVNNFSDRITLVTNAVSNKREKVYFKVYSENKGGTSMWEGKEACKNDTTKCPFAESVYMDDLVPLAMNKNITKAIMKMDIEGAEHLAMREANNFFDSIDVHMIIMEVAIQRMYCGTKGPDSEDKRLTNRMLAFLDNKGFTRIYSLWKNRPSLNKEPCSSKWPRDVLWVKHGVAFSL